MNEMASPFPRFGGRASNRHVPAIEHRLALLRQVMDVDHASLDTYDDQFLVDIGQVSFLLYTRCPGVDARDMTEFLMGVYEIGGARASDYSDRDVADLRLDASVMMPLRKAGVDPDDLRDAVTLMRRRPRVTIDCFGYVRPSRCDVWLDGLRLYREGSAIYAMRRDDDVTVSGRTITVMRPFSAPDTVMIAMAGQPAAEVVRGIFPDGSRAVIAKAWCSGEGAGRRLSMQVQPHAIEDEEACAGIAR